MPSKEELYKKYRPTELAGVIGQDPAVAVLTQMIADKRVAHSIMFNGPSGCGKTTLARILANKIGCAPHDLAEINAAEARGIDDIRRINEGMRMAPVHGRARVYIIDECHKLTNDAQNALLKPLEDTPRHVYFFLCTTDPGKLIKTIQSRCTEIKIAGIGVPALKALLKRTAEAETMAVGPDVLGLIAEAADGNARKALVILNTIVGIEDEENQLAAIARADFKTPAFKIAQVLANTKSTWAEVAAVLRDVDFAQEDYEGIRHMVMGYATAILAKGVLHQRAELMLYFFSKPFYENKKNGLYLACLETIKPRG